MAVFEPIGEREMLQIAEKMIKRIKLVCPRFSVPADEDDHAELIKVWAGALRGQMEYPRSVYWKALEIYASTATRDDNPPMPGDILRFCRLAVERMESDPVTREKLSQWREARRLERDRRMGPI